MAPLVLGGCVVNRYDAETAEHERLERCVEPVYRWINMLVIEAARRQYNRERKLSEQLGFDVVEIGGEG